MARTSALTRRARVALTGAGVLALATAVVIANPVAAPACGCTDMEAFTTPGAHTFTVPADVEEITVFVSGAAGGNGYGSMGGFGGYGATVRATYAVTPGDEFGVYVGTMGNAGGGSGPAGGGGSSAVHDADDDTMIVAGGGGGAGGNNAVAGDTGGNGGAGAAANTAAGGAGSNGTGTGTPGNGGGGADGTGFGGGYGYGFGSGLDGSHWNDGGAGAPGGSSGGRSGGDGGDGYGGGGGGGAGDNAGGAGGGAGASFVATGMGATDVDYSTSSSDAASVVFQFEPTPATTTTAMSTTTTTTVAPTTTTAAPVTTTTAPEPDAPTTTTIAAPGANYGNGSATLVTTPGGTITVSAHDFKSESDVGVTLHSDPVSLGSATTDENGDFTKSFTIPVDTELGAHTIVLDGVNANGEATTVTLDLTVTSALPYTGSSVWPSVFAAAMIIAFGLLLARRRRVVRA